MPTSSKCLLGTMKTCSLCLLFGVAPALCPAWPGPVRLGLTPSVPRNYQTAELPNRRGARFDRIANREALPRDLARFGQPCCWPLPQRAIRAGRAGGGPRRAVVVLPCAATPSRAAGAPGACRLAECRLASAPAAGPAGWRRDPGGGASLSGLPGPVRPMPLAAISYQQPRQRKPAAPGPSPAGHAGPAAVGRTGGRAIRVMHRMRSCASA